VLYASRLLILLCLCLSYVCACPMSVLALCLCLSYVRACSMSVLVLYLCLSYVCACPMSVLVLCCSSFPSCYIRLFLSHSFHPYPFSTLPPFHVFSSLFAEALFKLILLDFTPSPFFLVFPIFFIRVVYVVLSHLILSFPVILYRSCYAFCILLSCPSFLLCPVLFVSSFPILPVLSCPDDHFLHPYAFLYYSTFPVLSILSFPFLFCPVMSSLLCSVISCSIMSCHILSFLYYGYFYSAFKIIFYNFPVMITVDL